MNVLFIVGADPAALIASSEKIKRELGWQPQFQDLRVIIESVLALAAGSPRRVREIVLHIYALTL